MRNLNVMPILLRGEWPCHGQGCGDPLPGDSCWAREGAAEIWMSSSIVQSAFRRAMEWPWRRPHPDTRPCTFCMVVHRCSREHMPGPRCHGESCLRPGYLHGVRPNATPRCHVCVAWLRECASRAICRACCRHATLLGRCNSNLSICIVGCIEIMQLAHTLCNIAIRTN